MASHRHRRDIRKALSAPMLICALRTAFIGPAWAVLVAFGMLLASIICLGLWRG